MTIRFGIAAHAAGSICVAASRLSQPVSDRIAMGAMNIGPVCGYAKVAARAPHSGIAAIQGVE
jgi:hypothetical protein